MSSVQKVLVGGLWKKKKGHSLIGVCIGGGVVSGAVGSGCAREQ